MAEGNPPNSQHKPYFAMLEIKLRPPQGLSDPSQWSQEFNRFVGKCLTIDPDKRPNAEELLLDPFILINTKRTNPQGLLMNLVQENMESIRIFRKNLLKNQKFEAQEEKKKQPQEQNKKSEQDQQKNNQNRALQDDKKSEKRLMTEFSQDYQDFVVNESGTIIEYQNYDEFISQADQHQQFYKQNSSPSQLRDKLNDKQNNFIWENETGTMVEKVDDENQLQKIYQNNNIHQNNDFMKQFNKKENNLQQINLNQQQIDNEEDEGDVNEQNNSVIIKEDHEIENIKGQAYSGVVQTDSSQKPQQKVPDFVLFARQMEDNALKKNPLPSKNFHVNIYPENIKKEASQQQSPSQEVEIPSECKNMNEQMIENKIEMLKKELEMEIKQLQDTYAQKISKFEIALKIVKSQKNTSITSISSQSVISNTQHNQQSLIQQTNNLQNQEPISPIKRPQPQTQQIQYGQSPQPQIIQNQEYQQQSLSPLLVSSALPQLSQSPYIKSQLNNNVYYDSNNNSNIMNSSTNITHQIPSKICSKISNNNNNSVITSTNNILSQGSIHNQQNLLNTQNIQNPLLSNIYSEMPLPATPKTKEKQQINNFVQGIQTQPASSNIYSNCMKDNQKNMITHQQFTNGLSNLPNQSHQQDDIINHIRRQLSNNTNKSDSNGALINQQKVTQNIETQPRKANNHPINLLNSSKNNQQIVDGYQMNNKNLSQTNNNQTSNGNLGLSLLTSGCGLSFEEALSRKNLLKQNQVQNTQNVTNNMIYDENSIYKFQLYMQQQQDGGITKVQSASPYLNPSIQTNTPNKLTSLEQQNILQQKSILNNNRQLPLPNNFNAIERTQTEQSHQEFLALQAKKPKLLQQQNGIPQTPQLQNNNQTDQMKDNQCQRDNSIKLQQNQQSNNISYNANNNNSSRSNQIQTQKLSVNSNQNNPSSNMIDNYSQSRYSAIYNQQSTVQNQQQTSTPSQAQQILSRSQNLQNNVSTGSQKFNSNANGKNNSQEGNTSFLSNGQKSKNNNSYISNNHSNTNSIDEQKQYSNLNKNHLIVLQKKNATPLTSKDQSKSANSLSQLNQQHSQTQLKQQNASSGISFKQLLNQQNEKKAPQNNYS